MGIIIENGKRPLTGSISLSGAKNSALKILAASVLAKDCVLLENIPLGIHDVRIKGEMLRTIGARLTKEGPNRLKIYWPKGTPRCNVSGDFGSVRTSILFLGALLSRLRRASVPSPGGCRIGERKHDLHIMALERLGAVIKGSSHKLEAEADLLKGACIEFPIRTTGGTENAILASVCADGQTTLYNAHTRPEVFDLVHFLNKLGAQISLKGSGLIQINGVKSLGNGQHSIIYDNMEAMTFAIFASITKGDIYIENFPQHDLEIPMIYLRESGVQFIRQNSGMIVKSPGTLTPFDLSTGSYPGINSDMQPLFAVLATQAEGMSRITDTRFKNRFQYVSELRKIGADIDIKENTMIIRGPTSLQGSKVMATDLRGGAALIAAALVADGRTFIEGSDQIDRGYENLDLKLRNLGVSVIRSTEGTHLAK